MVELVCGIGASAGGLKAVEGLLPDLPVSKKIAYIFLQHSAPHESSLADLLKDFTRVPIQVAEDGLALQGGKLYLCPPATQCVLDAGRFRLESLPPQGPWSTIDTLFASLARQYSERTAGIILSGTGSDGVTGLREIKAAGGWVLVQDPDTAEYSGMPRHAQELYLADFVRPVTQLAQEMGEILRLGEKARAEISDEHEKLFTLLEILENKSGFNFTRYKEAMLLKRIRRRMTANKINTLGEYILLVQKSQDEIQYLIKDLFIGVTGFYRGKKVFERLNQQLRKIVEAKKTGESIRVWSVGCATGEEAFTIALLLMELQKELAAEIEIKIFATDADEDAITFARRGIYSLVTVQQVPPQLLQIYFDQVDGGYQVCRELRDMVVFAAHDITHDTAFSKMDLICCRNLLIYLNRPTQNRLLSCFHYSLNKGGYLLLGASEKTGSTEQLFKVVDRQHSLYQRLEMKNRTDFTATEPPVKAGATEQTAAHIPWQEEAWEIYFGEYAPAAVMLNGRFELMHVHGEVNAYLELSDGNFNSDILHLARSELRIDMQMVLQQARRSGNSARSRPVKLVSGIKEEGPVLVTMTAINAQTESSTYQGHGDVLLVFEECPLPKILELPSSTQSPADKDEHIRALEEELAVTREQLQSNMQALEVANQELQSVTEEFHSTMEELQSSSEEFQTSNEELESNNEELISVNDELKSKSRDLGRVNEELDTLLNAVLSGIILLDADLQVTRYSESCRQLFKLWPQEVSNIHQLMLRMDGLTAISSQIRRVMRTGRESRVELELEDKFFEVRLIPVRNPGKQDTHGLVIAFYDQTQREKYSRESDILAAVVRSSEDAILVQDLKGRISSWNNGARQMFGYGKKKALQLKTRDLIARGYKKRFENYIKDLLEGGKEHGLESRGLTHNGNTIDIWSSASVLMRRGKPEGVAVILRDISENKAVEAKLNALVESSPDPLFVVDATGTIQRINKQVEALFGYLREELIGQSFMMLVPDRYHDRHKQHHKKYLQAPVMRKMGEGLDTFCLTRSGEEVPMDVSLSPLSDGREISILVRVRDIRAEKKEQDRVQDVIRKLDQANRTKTRFLAAASHDLRQPLQSINMYLGALSGNIGEDDRKRAVDKALMAVSTADNLLNSLLNINKLESDKVEPEIESFVIAGLLQRVYNVEAPHAQVKQQDFAVVLSSVRVLADPILLEQLVSNLVSNAIKYSPARSHIVLGCRRSGSHLKIQVADNGPGIPREQLDEIFEEYRQLNKEHSYPGKGLGLGMAVVKLIAELLELELEVFSEPGKGSCFSVLVPVGRSRPTRRRRKKTGSQKAETYSGNILLVEDDSSVLESTAMLLELSGYRVVKVRNSRQALTALKNHKVDIIVTDYGLVESQNGIDLVGKLRSKLKTRVPALVVTGDTSEQRRKEAHAAGCEIIAKPIEAQSMLNILNNLLTVPD